jgi:uncharacterized protein YlbG (UPF0298 family)
MARARNIKPAFFTNDELAELTPLERLAFIGMWTVADYKGCIEFKPKRLKVQLLPYDECDFEQIVNNLDKSGFIRKYFIQGNSYLKIVNFEKHQNPHKNEREAGSNIPDYLEQYKENNDLEKIEINLDKDGTTRADSLLLIPDSLNPIKPLRTSSLDSGFYEFWNAYPKKTGKDKAEAAWIKKKPDVDKALFALSWLKETEQWQKGIIPNPATWINEGRWKDEQPTERTPF